MTHDFNSGMIAEDATVREKSIVPFWDYDPENLPSKFFDNKILPASDCAP